jgi:hypothetical protein
VWCQPHHLGWSCTNLPLRSKTTKLIIISHTSIWKVVPVLIKHIFLIFKMKYVLIVQWYKIVSIAIAKPIVLNVNLATNLYHKILVKQHANESDVPPITKFSAIVLSLVASSVPMTTLSASNVIFLLTTLSFKMEPVSYVPLQPRVFSSANYYHYNSYQLINKDVMAL